MPIRVLSLAQQFGDDKSWDRTIKNSLKAELQRFVGEGISPGMVWSTRHFSGILIILIFLLSFSGLLWISEGFGVHVYSGIFLIALTGVFLLASYGIAQWISVWF